MLHLKEKTSLLLVNEEGCLHIVASDMDALYLWHVFIVHKEGPATLPLCSCAHTRMCLLISHYAIYQN